MRICTPHSAMAHTMVMASAIDAEMTDSELLRIGQQINRIPLFEDYEPDKLATDAAAIADPFVGDGGVDAAIDQIKAALPTRLRKTAYAFACEIVAADGHRTSVKWLLPYHRRNHIPPSRSPRPAADLNLVGAGPPPKVSRTA